MPSWSVWSPHAESMSQPYSRRQFLQLVGVTLLANQLKLPPLFDLPSHSPSAVCGRALSVVPVYSGQSVVGQLWPDSVIPILGLEGDWFRVAEGYVRRVSLQPMQPYEPAEDVPLPESAFWAEVAGPVAAIRRWCAADAPLATRIGHGGVARVIDALPDERTGKVWYGVAAEAGDLLGWTQAVHWRPAQAQVQTAPDRAVHIDLSTQRLMAWDGDQPVLRALISTSPSLPPGNYAVTGRQTGGFRFHSPEHPNAFYGLPWAVFFGNNRALVGVYWHNQFGAPVPGPAVQLTPLLARWLYGWLGDEGRVIVQ